MRILEPFHLGPLTLRNRMVMPGMDTNFGDEEGNPDERTIRYYDLRARGGVGLIVVEGAYFDRRGSGTRNMLSIETGRKIPRLAELTRTIHRHGAHALLQIYHAGSQASSFLVGMKPVAPSDVPFRMSGEVPVPLERRQIRRIVRGYAAACARARRAGFDGVEIHAGHGYLLNQFFSPLTNHRSDEYGGRFENRSRVHVQILRAVRRRCGHGFLIGFRLNGRDYIDGGVEVEETCRLARRLEEEGADLLNITGGIFDSPGFPVVPYMSYPRGVFADEAAAVKNAVSRVPVCVVGRLNTPEAAERVLAEGKADLVALGRALIADPLFPRKTAEGAVETIRPCIGCNACLDRIMTEQPVACAVNPDLLGEEPEARPAALSRRVLVVGGGPAGLEAARVAGRRGHEVLLVEREATIGGALSRAFAAPMTSEIGLLPPYYARLLGRSGSRVRLGTGVSVGAPEELSGHDVVILATGAEIDPPDIPGLDPARVSPYTQLLGDGGADSGGDAGGAGGGERSVVLGGGMIGLAAADLLARRGGGVVIVEPGRRLGADLYALVAREVVHLVEANPRIRVLLESEPIDARGESLTVRTPEGERSIEFDRIVVAGPRTGKDRQPGTHVRACSGLHGADPQRTGAADVRVYTVGDCREPGRILDAVHGAYSLALAIGDPEREERLAASGEEPDDDAPAGPSGGAAAGVAHRIRSGTFTNADIPDYLDVLVAACNSNRRIQKKSRRTRLGFQFEIEGELSFWISVDRGRFSTASGRLSEPDVVIRMDRRIAAGIFTGEVNAAAAYMAKELAFDGPMRHGIAFRTWVDTARRELGL